MLPNAPFLFYLSTYMSLFIFFPNTRNAINLCVRVYNLHLKLYMVVQAKSLQREILGSESKAESKTELGSVQLPSFTANYGCEVQFSHQPEVTYQNSLITHLNRERAFSFYVNPVVGTYNHFSGEFIWWSYVIWNTKHIVYYLMARLWLKLGFIFKILALILTLRMLFYSRGASTN